MSFAASALAAEGSATPPPPPAPPKNFIVPDQGKLLLTAGFNEADGAGGGGLVPFAFITGYGSDESYGVNAHYTYAPLRDFDFKSFGIGFGLFDRVELTIARQDFEATDTALDGVSVSQDIFGLKVRVFGDAVYEQDNWMPQIAVGVQFKRHRGIEDAGALVSVKQLGAQDEDGTDYYVAATKVLLDQSLLFNLAAALHQGQPARPPRLRWRPRRWLLARGRRVGWLPADAQARDRRGVPRQAAQSRRRRRERRVGCVRRLGADTQHLGRRGVPEHRRRSCAGHRRDARSERSVRVAAGRILRRTNMRTNTTIGALLARRLAVACRRRAGGADLYEQIGGEPVLRKTVEEFIVIMEKDDRINFAFGNTDITKFKQLLFEQMCNITGGPCKYTGRTMKESHEKLAVNNVMFNALAEDVYIAFDRAGVPYRLQNKVMAIFAPMQRDIVK